MKVNIGYALSFHTQLWVISLLSPTGSLYVFAVFLFFSVLFIIVIPTLFGIIGSTKTLMILGLAFTFTITNMASLSAEFHWFTKGDFGIQLALFIAIFLFCWILYNLAGRKVLYIAVAVFFLLNSAVQLVHHDGANIAPISADNMLQKLVGLKKPLFMPNIYLLLYDAYVINETMLAYGIDNSSQEKYLEKLGFQLYPHNYSIGASTTVSMNSTLNASRDANWGTSGNGITQNLLKSFGYETYGIFYSDYFNQGVSSSYDFSFSKESNYVHQLLVKAIFMGEFRFDVWFGKPSCKQFREYKLGVFDNVGKKPRFVYMHTNLPIHSQNSGACLPNETDLFRKRLIMANGEMKRDIETITKKDHDALIIVAGDHGPYLTKNCTRTGKHYDISKISRIDIQDRFGSFLAIKWPTEDFSKYDNITVLQDIFPAIFAYLFKDAKLLESKVAPVTFSWEDPAISGASVSNGIIYGGINDGEPLFLEKR